jgi:hypothetical protein
MVKTKDLIVGKKYMYNKQIVKVNYVGQLSDIVTIEKENGKTLNVSRKKLYSI